MAETAIDVIVPDYLGLTETIQQHARPSLIGYTLYELLSDNGYSDEEIEESALAMVAIAAK
jgi:hypothetical protein